MDQITMDTSRFDGLLNKLRGLQDVRVNGKPLVVRDVLRHQAGLFVKEIIQRTPPTSNKNIRMKGETDKRIGENAVTRDLKRALKPIEAKDWTNARMKKAIQAKDEAAVQALVRNLRGDKKFVVHRFMDTRLHTQMRDSRGRVGSDKHKGTLDVQEWKKYLRLLKSRVGRMKSGWAPAARALGVKVVSWVDRHQGKPGWVNDATANPTLPSVVIANRAKGIGETAHFVRRALAGREKAMAGDIKFRLRALAREANAT